MIGLDVVLDRLLRLRAWRRAFAEGRWDVFELAPADVSALGALDAAELERAAARVRKEVFARRHRGVGTLLDAFPETIRAASRVCGDLDELAARFLESPAYEAHRELPFAGPGTCLEEAFYRFAEAEALGDPGTRLLEFLRALMRALAVSPTPAFVVPPEARPTRDGWIAIGPQGRVFAAVAGRYLEGAVPG